MYIAKFYVGVDFIFGFNHIHAFNQLKNTLLFDDLASKQRARRRKALLLTAYAAMEYIKNLPEPVKRPTRHRKLVRANLIPNPRFQTPWQQLYHSRDDSAYIATMGVDVDTFRFIMSSGFAARWNNTPIPRDDVSANGNPRLSRRSLNAAGGLGLALCWLRSGMGDTALQQIFALVPSVHGRYLDFALTILHSTLGAMNDARVTWPSRRRMSNVRRQQVPARP